MINWVGWAVAAWVGCSIYDKYQKIKADFLKNMEKEQKITKQIEEYEIKIDRWKNNIFLDIYDELEFYFYLLDFIEKKLSDSLKSQISLFDENNGNFLFFFNEKLKWEQAKIN